jgi:hypothetical protein
MARRDDRQPIPAGSVAPARGHSLAGCLNCFSQAGGIARQRMRLRRCPRRLVRRPNRGAESDPGSPPQGWKKWPTPRAQQHARSLGRFPVQHLSRVEGRRRQLVDDGGREHRHHGQRLLDQRGAGAGADGPACHGSRGRRSGNLAQVHEARTLTLAHGRASAKVPASRAKPASTPRDGVDSWPFCSPADWYRNRSSASRSSRRC